MVKFDVLLDELEDALRLEAEAEDLQTNEEGIVLVRWLRKRRRIARRIQRIERRFENA